MYSKRRLLKQLATAESKLRDLGDKPVWSAYESGRAMADFISHARDQIEKGTLTQADKSELWGIFAPTCDWDDVIGDPDLGNDIFSMLNDLD